MKKKDLDQWIAALRSGEYEQGQSWMCSIDGNGNCRYCCLGVMMEELHDDEWELPRGSSVWRIDGYGSFPSPGSLEKLGLNYSFAMELAKFNDGGKSFKWIASYLERYSHKVLGQ